MPDRQDYTQVTITPRGGVPQSHLNVTLSLIRHPHPRPGQSPFSLRLSRRGGSTAPRVIGVMDVMDEPRGDTVSGINLQSKAHETWALSA